MNLLEWFNKGIQKDQYIRGMTKHQTDLINIHSSFQLLKEETSFLERVKEEKLKVIVLTEDWCGDAMLNVPILLKMAEKADIDVRFLYRDENIELMDQYLTNGTSRSIPIFIFINEEGEEKAVWGPRAQAVQELVNSKRSSLPPLDHEDFQVKQNEMIEQLTEAFVNEKGLWQEVYRSMKTTIAERLL
ncbi:hypothetical protein JOC78_003189 [Bacillus ectoiniformans]|uniref:thioredoxin family protein n=1 Tax=Bacillus ectoiniformans TaxID=1494429 RepID=UPI00195C2A37|nr:thioredoxin family protein [Bacillus ectoiniformans]MBM7650205.1 hypothetical protein [Bacillus ectoiniformans]